MVLILLIMSLTKLYFQLWVVVFYFHLHAQPAMSFDLQLPDIRAFRSCNIDKIYQLGASFSDTGNRVVEDPMVASSRLPYGESTFLGPTGRYSDGLLVIDYIAVAAGLPLLNPYLKDDANFSHGVNFAVGGATAFPAKNYMVNGTNSSLSVQLEWMSDHLASQRNTDMHSSPRSIKNALFVVGEIGRNDYHFAFTEGKTFEEARNMVPEITEIINSARVIDLGAAQVIVPGVFPLGCFAGNQLTDFESNDESAYDEHQCEKEFNDFTEFHNEYLQQMLIALQEENPRTTILYADYYNAFKWLLSNAPYLGFDAASELKGCWGNAGDSLIEGCGSPNVPVCSNPDRHISWDGVHFTQRAHSVLATRIVADLIPKLNCAAPVEAN